MSETLSTSILMNLISPKTTDTFCYPAVKTASSYKLIHLDTILMMKLMVKLPILPCA